MSRYALTLDGRRVTLGLSSMSEPTLSYAEACKLIPNSERARLDPDAIMQRAARMLRGYEFKGLNVGCAYLRRINGDDS